MIISPAMEREILSLWFIRLRWFAFIGQLLILLIAIKGFGLTLPWVRISCLMLLIPISNILVTVSFFRKFPEKHLIGILLAFDTAILTAVLCQAGGPTNPFTIVYLLHVVIAAVMLTTSWTWGIALLSSFAFGMLFLFSIPVVEWQSHGAHHGFSLHLHGMLFAYVVVALLVAYFLSNIVSDLHKKERRLQRLEIVAANQRRLASLTTITAGAAHELGTPLATITVVSHELERMLQTRYPDKDLLDDIALLKNEAARCKAIIQELSEKSGDLLGEPPQSLQVMELLRDAISPFKANMNLFSTVDTPLKVPRKALTFAVRALVKNAIEATNGNNEPVEISVQSSGQNLLLNISDKGIGMSGEELEQIGEPFFSTKEENGMGLGVYLAKLTVEQLGGQLTFESKKNLGTLAVITFPLDCSQNRDAA